jgi:hypothetical protein
VDQRTKRKGPSDLSLLLVLHILAPMVAMVVWSQLMVVQNPQGLAVDTKNHLARNSVEAMVQDARNLNLGVRNTVVVVALVAASRSGVKNMADEVASEEVLKSDARNLAVVAVLEEGSKSGARSSAVVAVLQEVSKSHVKNMAVVMHARNVKRSVSRSIGKRYERRDTRKSKKREERRAGGVSSGIRDTDQSHEIMRGREIVFIPEL